MINNSASYTISDKLLILFIVAALMYYSTGSREYNSAIRHYPAVETATM